MQIQNFCFETKDTRHNGVLIAVSFFSNCLSSFHIVSKIAFPQKQTRKQLMKISTSTVNTIKFCFICVIGHYQSEMAV